MPLYWQRVAFCENHFDRIPLNVQKKYRRAAILINQYPLWCLSLLVSTLAGFMLLIQLEAKSSFISWFLIVLLVAFIALPWVFLGILIVKQNFVQKWIRILINNAQDTPQDLNCSICGKISKIDLRQCPICKKNFCKEHIIFGYCEKDFQTLPPPIRNKLTKYGKSFPIMIQISTFLVILSGLGTIYAALQDHPWLFYLSGIGIFLLTIGLPIVLFQQKKKMEQVVGFIDHK